MKFNIFNKLRNKHKDESNNKLDKHLIELNKELKSNLIDIYNSFLSSYQVMQSNFLTWIEKEIEGNESSHSYTNSGKISQDGKLFLVTVKKVIDMIVTDVTDEKYIVLTQYETFIKLVHKNLNDFKNIEILKNEMVSFKIYEVFNQLLKDVQEINELQKIDLELKMQNIMESIDLNADNILKIKKQFKSKKTEIDHLKKTLNKLKKNSKVTEMDMDILSIIFSKVEMNYEYEIFHNSLLRDLSPVTEQNQEIDKSDELALIFLSEYMKKFINKKKNHLHSDYYVILRILEEDIPFAKLKKSDLSLLNFRLKILSSTRKDILSDVFYYIKWKTSLSKTSFQNEIKDTKNSKILKKSFIKDKLYLDTLLNEFEKLVSEYNLNKIKYRKNHNILLGKVTGMGIGLNFAISYYENKIKEFNKETINRIKFTKNPTAEEESRKIQDILRIIDVSEKLCSLYSFANDLAEKVKNREHNYNFDLYSVEVIKKDFKNSWDMDLFSFLGEDYVNIPQKNVVGRSYSSAYFLIMIVLDKLVQISNEKDFKFDMIEYQRFKLLLRSINYLYTIEANVILNNSEEHNEIYYNFSNIYLSTICDMKSLNNEIERNLKNIFNHLALVETEIFKNVNEHSMEKINNNLIDYFYELFEAQHN